MFIKKTVNSVGKTYYHLVESYREGGKVRQRTLLALGEAGEGKLDKLAHAIAKHTDTITAIQLAKEVHVDRHYILGPLLILDRMFEKLGIKACLERIQDKHGRLKFDLTKSVFTLVASRFVRPSSKLWVYDHMMEQFYPEMVDHEMPLHVLYRTLDLLVEHKEGLERELYWHGRDLFNQEVEVIFYDLTTLRFESIREDTGQLRRFGYSKEKRNDCTQVVLGLWIDQEGIPLGLEVYPGNTFEGKTLPEVIERLKKKYRIKRIIFVADRGLLSELNIACLKREGGEFIVGMRLYPLKARGDIYDISRYHWINEKLAVYETMHGEDRLIITWSQKRAERDQRSREEILKKIRQKLASSKTNSKKFVTHPAYRKYVEDLDKGTPRLNEKAIDEDALRDGFFGVLTNVKTLSAKEIVTRYKELWMIEDAFGELKGTLKTRPIYHSKDERIIGHLVLCFLSYLCEAHMTKALREHGYELKTKSIQDGTTDPRALTVAAAMQQVVRISAIPIQMKAYTIWVRTDINGACVDLFKAVGLTIPPRLLGLKKMGTPS